MPAEWGPAEEARLRREARRMAARLAAGVTAKAVQEALRQREESEVITRLTEGFAHLEELISGHIGDSSHIPPGRAPAFARLLKAEERGDMLGQFARVGFTRIVAVLGMISLLVGIALAILEVNALSHTIPLPTSGRHP